MATLEHVDELLDQAITCASPHRHGVVNLNRLREVLTHLVSSKFHCTKCLVPENSPKPNTLTGLSSESLSSVPANGAVVRNQVNATTSIDLSGMISGEQNVEILTEADRLITNVSSLQLVERSPLLLKQTFEPKEVNIWEKLKELHEHIRNIEAKVCTMEEERRKTETARNAIEEELTLPDESKSVGSDQAPPGIESTSGEEVVNFGGVHTIVSGNHTNTPSAPVPTTKSEKSVRLSLSEPKPLPLKTDNAIQQELYENVETNVHAAMYESTTAIATCSEKAHTNIRTESDDNDSTNCEENQNICTAFEALRLLVENMNEREAELCERQTQLEQTMASFKEELQCRCRIARSENTAYDDGSDQRGHLNTTFVQDDSISTLITSATTQHVKPHDIGVKQSFDYAASFETEVRSSLSELREEILLLKAQMGRPNVRYAAGGKLRLDAKRRVRCISCDGHAVINPYTEDVPKPMLLSTNRCLKPYLQNQLNLLQKAHHWASMSDLQHYRRSVKKI